MGWTGGSIRDGKDAPLVPQLCSGSSLHCLHCSQQGRSGREWQLRRLPLSRTGSLQYWWCTLRFKILLIKSKVLNIKLGQGGGGHIMGWIVDRSKAVRMPHLRHGRAAAVVFIVIVVLSGGIGGRSGSIAAYHCQGQAAWGTGGACCNNDKKVGKRATAGADNDKWQKQR